MKKKFLKIYSLVFIIFMFFSSVKCMFDLIDSVFVFDSEWIIYVIIFIFAIHIGTLLLIFSGRLKK